MHHGLAQVFGSGLALAMTLNDGAGGAVILQDCWISDGDISGALLEVGHGIAACSHDAVYERVGFADGDSGVVDETVLNLNPVLPELIAHGWAEFFDGEALNALLAIDELDFGFGGVATFEDGAIVLGTKLLFEVLAFALAEDHYNEGGDYDNRNNDYQSDEGLLIHGRLPSAVVMPGASGELSVESGVAGRACGERFWGL